jgi:peptidoglycan/LPS O-acetylase OafA/YrhL
MKNTARSTPIPQARERFRETKYFPALDGLRCFSIAAVIWHHCTPRQLEGVLGRGHLGVRLFFAISGFLITTLLLREHHRSGSVNVRMFWARRALRIFPLYYTVLIGFVAFAWYMPAASPVRSHFLANLPFFATHTSNWFINYNVAHPVLFAFAWSLSTEEQFYLGLPIIVKQIRSRALLASVIAGMILIDQLAERQMLTPLIEPHGFMQVIITSFAASIGFGALLAVVLDSNAGFRFVGPLLSHRVSVVATLTLVLAWFIWFPPHFVMFEAALALFVAACALCPGSRIVRWLSSEGLCHVGRVSYGMYLFHVPIIGALKRALPRLAAEPLALFPLAMVSVIFLATLSHRYFESAFLALRPGPK